MWVFSCIAHIDILSLHFLHWVLHVTIPLQWMQYHIIFPNMTWYKSTPFNVRIFPATILPMWRSQLQCNKPSSTLISFFLLVIPISKFIRDLSHCGFHSSSFSPARDHIFCSTTFIQAWHHTGCYFYGTVLAVVRQIIGSGTFRWCTA